MTAEKKQLIRAAAAFCAFLLCVFCVCFPPSANAASEPQEEDGPKLTAYFFSAGKADAILLTTENAAVMIDCGGNGFGQTILAYLMVLRIDRIDYLIITHFDKDHIGGSAKIINNFPVDTVLQSTWPKDSSEYEKYLKALDKQDLEAVPVREIISFTLDGVVFTVDPPDREFYEKDNSNNSSLIVTAACGEKTLLFLGDAETERLIEYLNDAPVDCDLLKIPHHGREEVMMRELIAAVKPEYAVICCSDEEPDIDDTLRTLSDCGTDVFLTFEAPVIASCDGSSISVEYAP